MCRIGATGESVALQGFGILLYSIVELQRPGDENSDWLVQCKQSKHGLISENYCHVPCSMQQKPKWNVSRMGGCSLKRLVTDQEEYFDTTTSGTRFLSVH